MWDYLECTPPVVCNNPEAIDGLEAALVRYNLEAAKFAVEHGCNPNGPIRICVSYAYGRLFRFEVDEEFVRTRAPKMFYYAWDGNDEAVKMLVKCGADILARDDDGHTLLHAIAMGHANWVCYHGNHLRSELDADVRRVDSVYPKVRFCLPFAVPVYLISNCTLHLSPVVGVGEDLSWLRIEQRQEHPRPDGRRSLPPDVQGGPGHLPQTWLGRRRLERLLRRALEGQSRSET